MPTPRPGKEGAAVLAALAADPGPDNLLLVVTARPEKEVWSSAWLKAFEKHGVFALSTPVEIRRLPAWISVERAARLGIAFDRGAAELLAERVEGNLLAAQQELEKLALLHPGARLDVEAVQGRGREQRATRRVPARRGELAGDVPRSLRSSRACGPNTEPPLVLWRCAGVARARRHANSVARKPWRAQERHEELVKRAGEAHGGPADGSLVEAAANMDRRSRPVGVEGDPWTS